MQSYFQVSYLSGLKVPVPYLLGGIIGFLAALALVYFTGWPPFVSAPPVGTAISLTETYQPYPTPSPIIEVRDHATEEEILPTLGEYKLNPGQKVIIELMPGGSRKLRWWLDPTDFGQTQDLNNTELKIIFIAPTENDRHGAVKVCETDPTSNYQCREGVVRDILIWTSIGDR